jgi:hypothetical protein
MVTPVPRPGPVLRIRSLGKTYGIGETAVNALRGVNLDIRIGELRGVAGRIRQRQMRAAVTIGGIALAVAIVIMGNFFRDAIGIVRTTTRLGHG